MHEGDGEWFLAFECAVFFHACALNRAALYLCHFSFLVHMDTWYFP